MSHIPPSAAVDVKTSFQEVWAAIDAIRLQQTLNLDLHGKRVINAGDGIQAGDYATKSQVDAVTQAVVSQTPTFLSLTVKGLVQFLGALDLPSLTDGSNHHAILFVNAGGVVTGSEDGAATFTFNDVTQELELGYAMAIHWLSLAKILTDTSTDGLIILTNNAGTGWTRLVLGTDDANGIALVKNGTTLEIRQGGAAGAFTAISASNIGGGSAGVFATVVIGTDPGGAALLRVGGASFLDGVVTAGDTTTGKFGSNGKSAQGSAASGGALAGYATGIFGLDSDAHMHALRDLVELIRTTLVADGTMS